MKELLVRELNKGYLVVDRRGLAEYVAREYACSDIAETAQVVVRLLSGEMDATKNTTPPEKGND